MALNIQIKLKFLKLVHGLLYNAYIFHIFFSYKQLKLEVTADFSFLEKIVYEDLMVTLAINLSVSPNV